MKLSSRAAPGYRRAFSLPELLVTMAVSLLISIAIVGSQLFGIRLTEVTQTKIHSTDKMRQLMRLFNSDIQTARLIQVGNGSYAAFAEAPAQTPQQGNALQIYPTDDPNVFVRYFHTTGDLTLQRMKSDGSVAQLAGGVSHATIFTLENFSGNVLTNRQYNAVIGIDLRFSRLENPDLPVGPQHHYKSYQFKTRMAQPML
jgi:prepilin-type N-terminal cleavage/methylation domain-containing protein